MKTILFGDNNGFRMNISKAIGKCISISLIDAHEYTKSGGITLSDDLSKRLVKIFDEYAINYSIQTAIKQVYTAPETEQPISPVESGIIQMNNVYILTQEAFDELTKYKQILKKLSDILSELNISDNE